MNLMKAFMLGALFSSMLVSKASAAGYCPPDCTPSSDGLNACLMHMSVVSHYQAEMAKPTTREKRKVYLSSEIKAIEYHMSEKLGCQNYRQAIRDAMKPQSSSSNVMPEAAQ